MLQKLATWMEFCCLFRRASAYVGRGDAADAASARADLDQVLKLEIDR